VSDRTSDNIEAMVDGWLAEGNDSTPGSEQEQTADGTGTPEGNEGTAPKPAEANADTQQPTGTVDKPADNAQRQVEPPPKAGPGDLVDGQGRVLARAGAERRHYEAAQRSQREVQSVRDKLQQTEQQLQVYKEASAMPAQLGLTPDETATGLQLVASWKQNPAGVIQYLVEQAKAAGHNLPELGSATDYGAIKNMIASELAPFRQQAQQQSQLSEAQTAARGQVDSLVSEYGEHALTNSEALAKLIDASTQAGRPLNLEQAYLRFSNWCLQNGFDPAQPIDPQIGARQQPNGQQPANQQRMPPRPNGRVPASPNGVTPIDPAASTSGNEPMRDLVRAAMREQGFNV
jgi:hypothetical protein